GERCVRERAREREHHEAARAVAERKRGRLAGSADDAAGGAGEGVEVFALAARRARGELRREAGGVQELEAERERGRALGGGVAPARRARGDALVEQRELAAEQVEDAGMGLGGLEQARDGVASACGGVEC